MKRSENIREKRKKALANLKSRLHNKKYQTQEQIDKAMKEVAVLEERIANQ